ncbi:MAG: hypothetical protein WCH34_10140 [Bacteroidota bacterium]
MKIKTLFPLTKTNIDIKSLNHYKTNSFVLLFLLIALIISAQNPVHTPYFNLNGSYQDVKKEQNVVSGNKAYNYSFLSANNKEYYMIGVMKYKNNPAYLEEIKNSSQVSYSKIKFQGQTAITSEREVQSQGSILFAKDIMFFRNNYFFSAVLTAQNREKVNTMYRKFQKNFESK